MTRAAALLALPLLFLFLAAAAPLHLEVRLPGADVSGWAEKTPGWERVWQAWREKGKVYRVVCVGPCVWSVVTGRGRGRAWSN